MYSFKFSHAAGLVDPNCMLTRGLVDPNSMRFNSFRGPSGAESITLRVCMCHDCHDSHDYHDCHDSENPPTGGDFLRVPLEGLNRES
jgi:hypothetical protein